MIPLYLDVALKRIGNIAVLRPLLYWLPDLKHYSDGLAEVMQLDKDNKIMWLYHVKNWLTLLGLSNWWSDPHGIPIGAKESLKRIFFNYIWDEINKASNADTLTGRYCRN